MSKTWKIVTIVTASILLLVISGFVFYFFFPWNKDFFENASEEFELPALEEGFCPQGITKIESKNKYIISGYMLDKTPSRFYIVDAETKVVENYFTLKINGNDFKERATGLVSCGATLWTVSANSMGGGYLYRFLLNEVLSCENGKTVEIIDYLRMENNADFAFEKDGMIWIGENYVNGETVNLDNHHVKTRSGEENTAMVYGYLVDESRAYGLSTVNFKNGVPFPSKALSIKSNVKGMDFSSSGDLVLVSSNRLNDSEFYYYNNVLSEDSHSVVKIGFSSIPMWYLDENALVKVTKAPCMAQEFIIENSRAYIVFGSGSNNTSAFAKNKVKSVYSVDEHYLKV